MLLCWQLPFVDDEVSKATESQQGDATPATGQVQRLVTADGTYATQSAITMSSTSKTKDSLTRFVFSKVIV